MAFFKSAEEKQKEYEETLKEVENMILEGEKYEGRVGQIHQGLSTFGLWGVRDNGKIKFKPTKFKISDGKLLIERNMHLILLSDMKDIFQDEESEAVIILNNGDGIPIKWLSDRTLATIEFKAFLNVLKKFIDENKSNTNPILNENNKEQETPKSEDKFDKLIKLGEMHKEGLLSDEEFASLKQELLSGANENTASSDEDNIEPQEYACENCGADISPDDIFCSECGTKIN